jgi:hypothetical protein
MANDNFDVTKKHPVFVNDAAVKEVIASIKLSDLNVHCSNTFSYSASAAAHLNIPAGGVDVSGSAASQYVIYDEGHWVETQIDGYTYDLGWSARLVVAITRLEAKLDVTFPEVLAASCTAQNSTARVQYLIQGLAGTADELSASLGQSFDVKLFAEYQVKLDRLRGKIGRGEITLNPVVIARQKLPDAADTNRWQTYQGYAYRLAGITGILKGQTAEQWYGHMTKDGKEADKTTHQKIANETFFKQCVDEAYETYGIPSGKSLTELSKPEQEEIRGKIEKELDGFVVARDSF